MLSNIGKLDTIITETVTAIENGKRQVFDIAENTRIEHQRLKMDLEEVRMQVAQLVAEVDALTIDEKKARLRLAEVSKNFKRFSEDNIKKAYEDAQEKQLRLATLRGRESLLRYKRNNLEQSMRRLDSMLDKAENLASQLAVVTGFLSGNLKDFYQKLGEMQQVQQLGISIIKAQEEERHRVARDIHDGPAQLLANIVMRAEFCLKLLDIDRTKVKEELQALQHMVRQSLQDVRKIIFDLRPMVLDDLGLVPAIKRYVEDFQGQYGLAVEFIVIGTPRRFSIAIEVAVFRIMQECVSNIRKHAQATLVAIKIEFLKNKLNAVVKDNGVGFHPETIINVGKKECFGILGMRERTQILNGEINVISAPGQGTTISVSVPLEGEE
ncbi:MAG: sensor histidine kinase [Actinobacteria bacterium]|nr:sensor histidine kinase [Actinomycetota bacterium]